MEAGKRYAEMLREIFIVSEEFRLPEVKLKSYVNLIAPFYPRFSEEILNKCLEEFELPSDIRLNSLSMGQKKKAFMSVALATNTRYLLMDEPTNGLDIPSKSQFRKVIANQMSDERIAILSIRLLKDIDHFYLFLDIHQLLMDKSIGEITEKYTFEYRQPQDMADVLYAEPTLQGNAVIAPRKPGTAETPVNLELLFNAVAQGKI